MSKQYRQQKFFLGANAAEGFASLYEQWVDQASMQAFYVLKGGAGCGKSSLMEKIAHHMEVEGYTVEYIACSGDPDSLDGIFIKEKEVAMVDGTAPHVIDPAFVGLTGHYVNLGERYRNTELFPVRKELIRAVQRYKNCYTPAYQCIRAAEESRRRGRRMIHTEDTLNNVKKQAEEILLREAAEYTGEKGKRSRRFLDGNTCKGRVLWEDTVSALCDRGYEIWDECGLSSVLLSHLERGFLDRGYSVISCQSPNVPQRLEHLLIPECSLAFLTDEGQRVGFAHISTEPLVERSVWEDGKSFLRLSNRVADDLMGEGSYHLARAKRYHDALEEYYHPYLDFSKADDLAERIQTEILSYPDQ